MIAQLEGGEINRNKKSVCALIKLRSDLTHTHSHVQVLRFVFIMCEVRVTSL